MIGVATMASRVLGLVRDQVLAYLFGAGDAMDAFRIAFRLPNVLRDLFAEGAMSAALVPTFTRAVAGGGRENAWRLGNRVINLMIVVTGLLAAAGMLFAGPLVRLYAGDFSAVPGKLELTIRLTRIMFPFLTLVTVAAVLMGMLNALHRFFIPALSPAMFNVATIVCAVCCSCRWRPRSASRPSSPSPSARSSAAQDRCCCNGRRCAAKAFATNRRSTCTMKACGRSRA